MFWVGELKAIVALPVWFRGSLPWIDQAGTPSQKRASRCHCGADLPRSARFCPMCGDKARLHYFGQHYFGQHYLGSSQFCAICGDKARAHACAQERTHADHLASEKRVWFADLSVRQC